MRQKAEGIREKSGVRSQKSGVTKALRQKAQRQK